MPKNRAEAAAIAHHTRGSPAGGKGEQHQFPTTNGGAGGGKGGGGGGGASVIEKH